MRANGRWRRLLVVPLLVGAVAGSGCGDGDGGSSDGSDGSADGQGDVEAARPPGFEASPAYLSAAIDASTDVPYRFEATVSIGLGGSESIEDVPALTGEFDGERSSTTTDPMNMALAMGGLPPGMEDLDLTTRLVSEGDIAYVHAPGWAEIDEPVDDSTPPIVPLAEELGDRWGRVDLAALGDDAGHLFSELNQGQNLDPAFYLELVQGTDRVEELGADIVDGSAQIGLAADVPMTALLEAQGIDPALLTASSPAEFDELSESLTLAVEVWLDGQGTVRRLAMDLGKGIEKLTEEHDFEGEEQLDGFEFRTDLTFFDHGDESIAVELPAEADTVDITETVRLLELERRS